MQTGLHLAKHVAIIGGGFSGMVLTYNLAAKAEGLLKITIIEKSDALGRGVAFGTKDPTHLLNVFTESMGALDGQPEHFYEWLAANEPKWRSIHPALSGWELKKEVCMPRMLFGAYLDSIWEEAKRLAESKGILIKHVKQEAINLFENTSRQLCVACSKGEIVEADAVVLAIGVPDNKEMPLKSWIGAKDGYISNIWGTEEHNILREEKLDHLREDFRTIIIGSGLTALDAISTLLSKGYQGEILCITAIGKFPEPHQSGLRPLPPVIDPSDPPQTALGLFRSIRLAIKKAADEGLDWRCVVDSLRYVAVPLWRALPWQERKKIIRHLAGRWNLLRHRMAEPWRSKLKKLRSEGKISIIQGFILGLDIGLQKPLTVTYKDKKTGGALSLEADYVLNCTGPKTDVTKMNSPLLKNLLEKKYVLPDPLRLGLQATDRYEARGELKGLYILGLLLLGERFETIAVPDLRYQCAEAADSILSSLHRAQESRAN